MEGSRSADEKWKKPPTWGLHLKRFVLLISKAVLMTICFFLYLILIPIFFVLMTPVYLYRFLVILAQKWMKPGWVGMMSSRDALVGLDNITDHCECMITLVLALKGEADLQLIRQVFQKEVLEGKNSKGELSYLKLKYYFENWLGFAFWKREENFQLEKHVRYFDSADYDDPNNNSDVVTEEQLMKALGSVATKPFARGVSPWEALVVKRYQKTPPKFHVNVTPTVPLTRIDKEAEGDVETAVVLRIHHAIGDGYSIMKLIMTNLCDKSLDNVPKAPVRKVSPLTQLFNYVAIICLTPYYHVLQFFINIDRTIWHLPSTKLTKQWQFTITERISFADLKETSKEHGVCVTATLLAGLAGGIHNYLRQKGKASRNNSVMRGLSPMPWKNHPMDTLVNHWTVGIFNVPVHEKSPNKRLLSAHKSAHNLKRSPILLTNFITVPILLGVPKWLTDFWGTNWMTTMIISNFPGPNFPNDAFYRSTCIEEVISFVPHMRGSAGLLAVMKLSLGIMFLSYNGGVRVSISVDKAIIKEREDLEELARLISQEFLTLRSLSPAGETVV